MRNNASIIFRFSLALGDMLALVLSFTAAYILRVTLDPRPFPNAIDSATFISSVFFMLPLWVLIFYMLGLYSSRIYEYKTREASRLFVAALLGIMMMVSYSFFVSVPLFPAKVVAVYAGLIGFVLLVCFRTLLRIVRYIALDHRHGLQRLVIIGNDEATVSLATYLANNPRSGYHIAGIVADKQYIVPTLKKKYYDTLEEAVEKGQADVVMQTDSKKSDAVYDFAVNHHLRYQYVPSHRALETTKHSTEIIGTSPVIIVQTTPLIGYGQVVKRIVDIVGSVLALVITSPLWLLVALLMKLFEPHAPVFFTQKRLTKHNKTIGIYKFRTMKPAYNGLSPEDAFAKMGKPELGELYRKNGDQLVNDPRISQIGRFLRSFSLDELPQLMNVLKGDISLVGPRALVPSELRQYPQKHLILSVKSGLTGLAQISGRRDISFDDRRALDIYYVHNWSLWLDIQIIFKTIWYVLFRKGAV